MSLAKLASRSAKKPSGPPAKTQNDSAVEALTKYIPTETITLYIATVSSGEALRQLLPGLSQDELQFRLYLGFVAFNPVILLLLFLRDLATAGRPWKIPVRDWPWWNLVASTISFAVWALAVPGTKILPISTAASGVFSGLAALFVSTGLNLLAPLFTASAKPAQPEKE